MSLVFRRAIVVGASSGIGEEIARQLAADGCAVALLGRREAELRRVADAIAAQGRGRALVAVHDVTNTAEVPELLDRLVNELGGLDLLVYTSGILWVPRPSEYDFEQDRRQMEINVIGAMAWMTPVVARFEAARAGTIIGLSSVAGERGRALFPGYSASKAAITAYLEALRNRVATRGVNIVTVKPGFVETAMTTDLERKPFMVSVQRAVALILAVARRGGSPSAFIPGRWWLVALVLRHMPSFLFRRLRL
jgi:short-subunit dehydrogenase